MTEQQKSRVLDINKIAATTIPSMAYMFSDKLATSAENTSDNLAQRGRHSIGLQCNYSSLQIASLFDVLVPEFT